MALPYVAGSTKAPSVQNVTIHEPKLAYDGLNLCNSGHGPVAFAMDMKGNILHTWKFTVDKIWPELAGSKPSSFWRRVYWYPNGDLLAIHESAGIIKIDKTSTLIWGYRGRCHHQAYVTPDGKIYVLTREVRINPKVNETHAVLEDYVVILDPGGRLLEEYNLLDCFLNSDYKSLLKNMRKEGELFHTNSIVVLDGSMAHASPVFKKGNILISIRFIDTIAIIDLDLGRVVWGLSGEENGMWSRQHDPRLLPNGRMLLFDNVGHNGMSKVIEFEPFTQKIVWQYCGHEQNRFYSKSCGISHRLPNGNTLITESDNGRALEVTPGGKIVWEFYNPFRVGENNELIATLFEMARVPKDFFPWLNTVPKSEPATL